MFTFEIRINSSLIAHIYGHNEGLLPNGKTKYRFQYYEVESRKVTNGFVEFESQGGIRRLCAAILAAVEEKVPKKKGKRSSNNWLTTSPRTARPTAILKGGRGKT